MSRQARPSVVQWTTRCEPTEPAGETLKPRVSRDSSASGDNTSLADLRKMGRASSCGRHACEPTEPAGETLKPRASRDSSASGDNTSLADLRKMGRASSCGRHACEPTEPAGETLKPRASRDSSVRLYKEMTQTLSGSFLFTVVHRMRINPNPQHLPE